MNNLTKAQIICGNAKEVLAGMPAESVQSVITSPPYWGLRAYGGDPGMIGLEPTFEEHLDNLVAVFREVRRVLRKDGCLWLNYGDAYWSNPGNNREAEAVGSSRSNGARDVAKKGSKGHFKPKDLMLLPARVALALQEDGWWVRSEIIFAKKNPMPESVTDRPTSAHEKVFLLTKSGSSLYWTHRDGRWPGQRTQPEPDYVWQHRDTKEEVPYDSGDWRADHPKWRRLNLWRGHDYFYDAEAVRVPFTPGSIERQKHPKKGLPRRDDSVSDSGIADYAARIYGKQRGHEREHEGFRDQWDGMTKAEQQANGSNLRNVWSIATAPFSGVHFATFPPALVEPCIKAGTSQKGCCSNCGAPWERVVEKDVRFVSGSGATGNTPEGKYAGSEQAESGSYDIRMGPSIASTTTGWQPTCSCRQSGFGAPYPTRPCLVLDPFGGAGTVGLVAQRLGRRSVCIEINRDYAHMARERCEQDLPLTQRPNREPAGFELVPSP